MSESFDASTLARLVLAHVDARPDSLRFTPIRIWLKPDKHNSSYWVDSDRGRLVLRIAPPDDAGLLFYERLMMRQEPRLHHLIRKTAIPVADVLGYDFSRARIDRDYVIMTALPGATSSTASHWACSFWPAARRLGRRAYNMHTQWSRAFRR